VNTQNIRLLLTTGDNIYAQKKFLGLPVDQTGDKDSDWFFTFFQPYRYIINRIPVFPCIGNHDSGESERDDREQLFDNFYLDERLAGDIAAGRASVGPGLFYRFRCGADIEFLCLDTSKEDIFDKRLILHPKHASFLDAALRPTSEAQAPLWRIPFAHHPPFCAGPNHHDTKEMIALLSRFKAAGVRAVFCGHEHNFQHSRSDGIDCFVTGGAAKVSPDRPSDERFTSAHTVSWSPKCHFLLVTLDSKRMLVQPVGESQTAIPLTTPAGGAAPNPIEVRI
jgi:3',5'-cyclic AMP phosphodiesterase CpdA